jgi:hypothetical protein
MELLLNDMWTWEIRYHTSKFAHLPLQSSHEKIHSRQLIIPEEPAQFTKGDMISTKVGQISWKNFRKERINSSINSQFFFCKHCAKTWLYCYFSLWSIYSISQLLIRSGAENQLIQEDSLPREHCDNACQCSRHLPGTFMMSQKCYNNACMRNTHQKNWGLSI